MSVPNQRFITNNKAPTDGNTRKNFYTPINLEALHNARIILTPNAFKFWTYLAENRNGFTFELSKVDTLKQCRFSARTYSTVFKELEDNRFLIPRKEGGNHFDFYEIPPEEEETTSITIHKETFRF